MLFSQNFHRPTHFLPHFSPLFTTLGAEKEVTFSAKSDILLQNTKVTFSAKTVFSHRITKVTFSAKTGTWQQVMKVTFSAKNTCSSGNHYQDANTCGAIFTAKISVYY